MIHSGICRGVRGGLNQKDYEVMYFLEQHNFYSMDTAKLIYPQKVVHIINYFKK